MYKLKIILGSTRPNRFSEKVLPWLMQELANHKDLTPELLDLRDHPLPFYDQPTSPSGVADGVYPTEAATAWAKCIGDADAFLIISPEYNRGYSAVLKNALDTVYKEWNNKPVAFISYGSVGGSRAVEQLRQVSVELQMAPIRSAVHIPAPWGMLDESGALKAGALDGFTGALKGTLTQLAWWAGALKTAREASK